MAENIKNEVLYRVYIVLFLLVIAALSIMVKTVQISVVEGPVWRTKLDSLYIKSVPVSAARGNILASDGSLLATSLPFFEIRMDLMTVDSSVFFQNVDSLAYCLATYIDNTYTVGGYRDHLVSKRKEKERYLLIKRNASYTEKEKMSQFPIFKLGQFQGGFIVHPKHKRMRPFKSLAYRTIGYIREGYKPVGLEGYFNEDLAGEAGKRLVFRAPGNAWIPLYNYSLIEPERGDDIVTTLDVNIQDITHKALLRALNHHDAESGTAVVMDVKTGEIKAIANLGRIDKGWFEIYNYAVGGAYEPGSTFKLASVMAVLEDGYLDLNDTIALDSGRTVFYEDEMVDAVYHTYDSTSLQTAFEISSNVGMAKMIKQFYGDTRKAEQFIKRLKQFNLHLPTGIEIEGEAAPYIKEAYSEEDNWSGTTLPWMAIGYESLLSPIQMLAFYNAVANDGMMMKPFLVREIREGAHTKKRFKPTVTRKSIASRATLEKAQALLAGVVERGTASKLKSDQFNFAGKTGTAQINYKNFKGTAGIRYRASFVGYFPAEDPVYSCIVVITDPKQNGRYGSEVAGPVFREIADRCFESDVDFHPAVNQEPKPKLAATQLPNKGAGFQKEIAYLLNYLDLDYSGDPSSFWAEVKNSGESDTLQLLNRTIVKGQVPSVVGMGLRDALFILENLGLEVQVEGVGKVVRQSILPRTKAKGQKIKLILG
jgi:cell division protein FtsI (penicillin-binding protein 3)